MNRTGLLTLLLVVAALGAAIPANAATLATTDGQTCAIRPAGGTPVCWGTAATTPPSTVTGAGAIAAGTGFACVIGGSGPRLACWGASAPTTSTPVASQVSAGGSSLCAIETARTLSCFGTLSPPAGLSGYAKAISVYDGSACAIKAGATPNLVCWGAITDVPAVSVSALSVDAHGVCGIQADTSTAVCSAGMSQPPATLGAVSSIATGAADGACATTTATGTVVCWGDDAGSGVFSQAPTDGGKASVAVGTQEACAYETTYLRCWGSAADGNVGVAPAAPAPAPAPAALAGQAYSATFTSGAGTPAGAFAATDATALPPGLTLSPTGTLAGVPTQTGTYTFTVVTDNGLMAPASSTFSIAVTSPGGGTVDTAPPVLTKVSMSAKGSTVQKGDAVDIKFTASEKSTLAVIVTPLIPGRSPDHGQTCTTTHVGLRNHNCDKLGQPVATYYTKNVKKGGHTVTLSTGKAAFKPSSTEIPQKYDISLSLKDTAGNQGTAVSAGSFTLADTSASAHLHKHRRHKKH